MQMVIRQDRVLQLIPFKLGLEYLQLLHKVDMNYECFLLYYEQFNRSIA